MDKQRLVYGFKNNYNIDVNLKEIYCINCSICDFFLLEKFDTYKSSLTLSLDNFSKLVIKCEWDRLKEYLDICLKAHISLLFFFFIKEEKQMEF